MARKEGTHLWWPLPDFFTAPHALLDIDPAAAKAPFWNRMNTDPDVYREQSLLKWARQAASVTYNSLALVSVADSVRLISANQQRVDIRIRLWAHHKTRRCMRDQDSVLGR